MLDGVDLTDFSDPLVLRELYIDRCARVPKDGGVYVVVRDTTEKPDFLLQSGAGWFKQRDPSYPEAVVKDSWVTGARIMYIGKAAGKEGLRQRIRQLIDFGFGKAVGHRGGRLLWHLEDHATMHLRWKTCPRASADYLESELISRFRAEYGLRPFANRAK